MTVQIRDIRNMQSTPHHTHLSLYVLVFAFVLQSHLHFSCTDHNPGSESFMSESNCRAEKTVLVWFCICLEIMTEPLIQGNN